MLTSTQVSTMRGVVEQTFVDDLVVVNNTADSDALGGVADDYDDIDVSHNCKLSYGIRGAESEFPGGIQPEADYRLDYKYNVTLTQGQRAKVNEDTYEVLHVSDEGEWRLNNIALLKKLG